MIRKFMQGQKIKKKVVVAHYISPAKKFQINISNNKGVTVSTRLFTGG